MAIAGLTTDDVTGKKGHGPVKGNTVLRSWFPHRPWRVWGECLAGR